MMPALRVHDLDGPCRYDFLVDASEGRDCDLFRLVFQEKLVFQVVLIKAIGIGIAPKVLTVGGDVIALANDSVWVLRSGSAGFVQHYHQFPVIDYSLTDDGLLVFDHIGCIMLALDTYEEKWRYHKSVLEDYEVDEDIVSLTFDDGVEVRLEVANGRIAT
jgi:hypothetical protein